MTPRARWILVALGYILICVIIAGLIFWNGRQRPYEKPEPIPVKVINAALAKHGNVSLVTVPAGLFFERGGKTIWVVRR